MSWLFSIENFLSYVGKYYFSIEPLTNIVCQSSVAKDDFNSVLAFVFGAELTEFGFEHPDDFIHNSLKTENQFPKCSVETIITEKNGKTIKFSRFVINHNICYCVDDQEVSFAQYKSELYELGYPLNVSKSDYFIAESLLEEMMYDQEGFEEGFSYFFENSPVLATCKKALNYLNFLKQKKQLLIEKKIHIFPLEFNDVEAVVSEFENLLEQHENKFWNMVEDQSCVTIQSSSSGSSTLETTEQECFLSNALIRLQNESDVLLDTMERLKINMSFTSAQLVVKKIRAIQQGRNETFITSLQLLKSELREKLDFIDLEIKKKEIELFTLSENIGFYMCQLEEYRLKMMNVVSPNGRLSNFYQSNDANASYLWILESVFGKELLNAFLFENDQFASVVLDCLRTSVWEKRECYLPLKNFSPLLLDTLSRKLCDTSSLIDVHLFLCTLLKFDVISENPVFVRKGEMPHDYHSDDAITIFIETGEFAKSDGTFGRFDQTCCDSEEGMFETASSFLIDLKNKEETTICELRQLISKKFECRMELSAVKDDLFIIEHASTKKIVFEESFNYELLPIWDEYLENFRSMEDSTFERIPMATSPEQSYELFEEISEVTNNLKILEDEFIQIKNQLKAVTTLASKHLMDLVTFIPTSRNLFLSPFLSDIYFLDLTLRIQQFKDVLKKDDVEDFRGGEEWRLHVLTHLRDELHALKTEIKILEDDIRKQVDKLTEALNFCNPSIQTKLAAFLPDIFTHPCFELNDSFDLIGQLTVAGKLINCLHTNTFIRFLTNVALLLSLAKFQKRRALVVNILDRIIPRTNADVISVFNSFFDDSKTELFQLCQRVGRFIQSFLDENLNFIITITNSCVGEAASAQLVLYNDHSFVDGQVLVTSAIGSFKLPF